VKAGQRDDFLLGDAGEDTPGNRRRSARRMSPAKTSSTFASAAGVRWRITSCDPGSRGSLARSAPPSGPSCGQQGDGPVLCVALRSREATRDAERCYPTLPQQAECAPGRVCDTSSLHPSFPPYESNLTPRLSCGARAQPCIRRRPPARRQLQPVVSRLLKKPPLRVLVVLAMT